MLGVLCGLILKAPRTVPGTQEVQKGLLVLPHGVMEEIEWAVPIEPTSRVVAGT